MKFIKIIGLILLLNTLNVSQIHAQWLEAQNPGIGQKAKDFTLKTLRAKKINMTKFRAGKSAIIFFWATWCPHCRGQLVELNVKRKEIETKGIKIILVDLGESKEQVRSYIERNKINLEVFLDEDESLSEEYQIEGVPTLVFIDQDGVTKEVKHYLPENYEEILEVVEN